MKMLLLLAFMLLGKASLCQSDKFSLKILEDIIRKDNKQRFIVYTDKVDKSILSRHIKAINKKKIRGISSDTDSNFIQLTKDERRHLRVRLTNVTNSFWADSLFSNSKKIQLDSAAVFTRDKKGEVRSFLSNLDNIDSIKRNPHGFNWQYVVYQFSDIVYLRNNSIFLNYCMWYDGSGGSVSLTFYKKEKDTWRRWILVSAGDW